MNTLNIIPEAIYNTMGKVAGNVYHGANNIFYLYDLKGKFWGTFSPVLNATYDAYGQFVGYGNQLQAILADWTVA